MIEAWTWIDNYVPLGILALGLSLTVVPLSFDLGAKTKNESLGSFLTGLGLFTILVVLWLGFGGAYLMTR